MLKFLFIVLAIFLFLMLLYMCVYIIATVGYFIVEITYDIIFKFKEAVKTKINKK